MTRLSAERLAQVSVTVLFLALVRTVGEYYRLRHVLGAERGVGAYAPYVPGLGLGIVGTWAAVTLIFMRRFRAATGVAALTVVALLLYKVVAMR